MEQLNNAEKFQQVFGLYATEMWAMNEKEFLEWLNTEIIIEPLPNGTDLNDLPSGVYRPKGTWIDHSEDGYVECPFCHEATNCDGNISELHYCWNCGSELGADMRVGKENNKN